MTLEESGTLTADAKIHYICTMIHGKALCQIDMLSNEVVSTTSKNLKFIILGLDTYYFLLNALSKQKFVMRSKMRKP